MKANYPKTEEADWKAPEKGAKETEGKSGAPELALLTSWHQSSYESARKKRWEMFVIDQFLRGNHDIKGNPNDNSIVVAKPTQQINYPINKMYATFRAVRGFVTRHKPVVLVEPQNSSEEAKAYARRANKILERDNQLNNFRKINKEWVYYGVKYGVGYRQVGYDPVKKCAIRWTVDPFDLLNGNKSGEIEDAPYLIKDVVRTIGYLKHCYPDTATDIAPDNELAADEYKRLSLQISYQQEATAQSINLDEQTKIVHECWYRLFKPNKAGGLINKVTFVDEKVLDFQETPYNEYPFIPYKSDIVPNEASGEGHMKHILSPQRMLNMLNTQALEYNHITNRGRIIAQKNSGFKVINTREGQIIFYNNGRRPEVLNPSAINPMLREQIMMAGGYIQDIGGQQDASMGRLPSASTSGDAIEALQQGDSNNISDLRDNFEDSLALEAQWILKMYSLFEGDGIVLTNRIKDEEEERYAVVGQKAIERTGRKFGDKGYLEDNGDYCDVCTILPDNQVKVSVTSQLGETRDAKLKLLKDLVELGLPLKVLLEHLEFPNISDLQERIASEALADIAMKQMLNPMGGPPGAAPGGPPTGPPGATPPGTPPLPTA